MTTLKIMIRRNMKLFFKDKGMFFTSLITPCILLVLYATFLGNVYTDSFLAALPENHGLSGKLIDGLVAGQLMSSLLAVSCVTVSFCANFLMVQDKATGVIKDLRITPVKTRILSISYYVSSFLSAWIICMIATVISLLYVWTMGWYLSAGDVLSVILDVFLLVLFGTALSSIINLFLSTQGQISAVGSVISAGYGFICGAYMPISSFSTGLQKAIMFLPGTYGTSLLRNHCVSGVFDEMQKQGLPAQAVKPLRDMVDCNLYFFGTEVPGYAMYGVLVGAVILLMGGYILLHKSKNQ